jgi:ABC-type uncharacterized transport system permease subunit
VGSLTLIHLGLPTWVCTGVAAVVGAVDMADIFTQNYTTQNPCPNIQGYLVTMVLSLVNLPIIVWPEVPVLWPG